MFVALAFMFGIWTLWVAQACWQAYRTPVLRDTSVRLSSGSPALPDRLLQQLQQQVGDRCSDDLSRERAELEHVRGAQGAGHDDEDKYDDGQRGLPARVRSALPRPRNQDAQRWAHR